MVCVVTMVASPSVVVVTVTEGPPRVELVAGAAAVADAPDLCAR